MYKPCKYELRKEDPGKKKQTKFLIESLNFRVE